MPVESTEDNFSYEQINESEVKNALTEIIIPTIEEMDKRVLNVKKSQENLSNAINHLQEELEAFVDASQPPILQPFIQKLLSSKNRILNINNILLGVEQRLLNLQKTVSNSTDNYKA